MRDRPHSDGNFLLYCQFSFSVINYIDYVPYVFVMVPLLFMR
jgi:hypothetical protein